MNVAEYIIKNIEELGVNEIFGVPGDYNFNILSAIENNSGTRWIGCTNELNAGYAADGYARIRGYGALVTTYGVGELSAMSAIAGSFAENVPICHIVGLPSGKNIEKKILLHHNFQEVDYDNFINAYKNVTAAAVLLTRDNAKLEIDRILRIMVKEKKPVYIALPADVALMEISEKQVLLDWESDKETLDEAVKLILEKIKNSTKPIILADVLIKRFEAKIEFNEFVSKTKIPLTNFLMGTDVINPQYENYLGSYFADFANSFVEDYINSSDCLIAIGTIYSDINSFGCKLPYKINDHIAIYGTYTYVDGKKFDSIKMSDLLEALTKVVEEKNIQIDVQKPTADNDIPASEKLRVSYIYSKLQEFFKENDIVIAETGIIPSGIGTLEFPQNMDILFQLLWGSIGWATPAAFGAAIAKPNARVILITGEGAHQQTAMEIGNMLRFGLKPIVIVINNSGYTTERFLCGNQEAEFNNIVQINYAKFSRVFDADIWATRVTNDEDFDKALKVTQIMNKMCYIEACTDKLDVSELTKKLLNTAKETCSKGVVSKMIQSSEEQKEILKASVSESFMYETTVHKNLEEKTSD